MLVRDRMKRSLVTVAPDTSLAEARRLLERHRIRQLPVLRGTRLVGIVSDRDLRSAPARARRVSEVMTGRPVVISPDASVDEAARILRTYKIGALPVVDRGALVGILSASDILDAFIDLSGVAEPTYRLVLRAAGVKNAEAELRRIAEHERAELKWVHRERRRRPPHYHLRLRTRRVDDLVTALESAGFEVLAVVAPPRKV